MPERDIEKAKQLLDEAGYTPNEDGVRIKDAEIVIFQFAVFSDIAKVVQANLKEIGIESKITTLEYAAWEERLQGGDFDRIEELFKLGRAANEEDRPQYYYEMQKIMSEELPVMPLTEWCYIVVTRDNITGHYAELTDKAGSGDYYYLDVE